MVGGVLAYLIPKKAGIQPQDSLHLQRGYEASWPVRAGAFWPGSLDSFADGPNSR